MARALHSRERKYSMDMIFIATLIKTQKRRLYTLTIHQPKSIAWRVFSFKRHFFYPFSLVVQKNFKPAIYIGFGDVYEDKMKCGNEFELVKITQ